MSDLSDHDPRTTYGLAPRDGGAHRARPTMRRTTGCTGGHRPMDDGATADGVMEKTTRTIDLFREYLDARDCVELAWKGGSYPEDLMRAKDQARHTLIAAMDRGDAAVAALAEAERELIAARHVVAYAREANTAAIRGPLAYESRALRLLREALAGYDAALVAEARDGRPTDGP